MMELNTKYIVKSDLDVQNNTMVLSDYRGKRVMTISEGNLNNGDIVALVSTNAGKKLMKIDSDYQIDSVRKKSFLREMNNLMQLKGVPKRFNDYGYWYIDIQGVPRLNGKEITMH